MTEWMMEKKVLVVTREELSYKKERRHKTRWGEGNKEILVRFATAVIAKSMSCRAGEGST
jgi:hypothetical protein